MEINIRPLGDRVIVEPVEKEEVIAGGMLVLPETAKEKPQEGEVVEVGSGRKTDEGKLIPLEVKKGDRVLYGKYSGTEVTIGMDEFLIMREADILAVIGSKN